MNRRYLKKFWSYYRPYRRLLVLDLLCAFVVTVATLLIPLGTQHITKRVMAGNNPNILNEVYTTGAVLVGLVVIYMLCTMFIDYQGHLMGAMMERDMRRELFEHYQKLSFSFYDEQKTGQLMSRLTGDLFWIAELCHHAPEEIIFSLIKLVGIFLILIQIDVTLTLIVFIFVPLMVIYTLYFNRKMNVALGRSKARIADVNTQVEDSLAGIRVVKSFTNEAIENEKFARENEGFLQSRGAGYLSEAYFYGGMTTFTQLLSLLVIVFGAVGMVHGRLDAADLLTYLLCIAILVEPIHRLVNFSVLYQEGFTGFKRFMEILDIAPDIQDAPDAKELVDVQGRIEFRDVSFRYANQNKDVLKNVCLDIQAGEYVALVGFSGVGKTTLCSLIPRFYEVSQGEILLDGQNIKEASLASLRRHIGLVQQDVYLFAGTIADNIRYGKPNASHDEIISAAKKANAHEFIMGFPDGYDTDIGQRGIKLSGGQKQRLSIARVFLKNPSIIIFDEATSALDNESERAVQASLEALARDRTTLVIAHRLSTIRNAQRILVLTENGIAEEGNHDDLLARDGVYAASYNLQLNA